MATLRALQRARRFAKNLSNRGYETCVDRLRPDMVHDLIFKYGVDCRSKVFHNEVCQLIIYDDQRYGKYLTNESEEFSYDDCAGFFKPRLNRRMELQQLVYQQGL